MILHSTITFSIPQSSLELSSLCIEDFFFFVGKPAVACLALQNELQIYWYYWKLIWL